MRSRRRSKRLVEAGVVAGRAGASGCSDGTHGGSASHGFVDLSIGTLVAVLPWVKLEETPEQSIERVAKSEGGVGSAGFRCETRLKSFETCTARNPNDEPAQT